MTIGRAQDTAILKLLAAQKIASNEDLNTVLKKVQQETSTILKENAVSKIV